MDAQQKMMLDLFCNSLNHVYLQRHLVAMKPHSLTEPVNARSEYLQIKLNTNPGVTIRQIKKEVNPKSVHVAQSKPFEMKVLFQGPRQLTSEVASLKQTQKATAKDKKGCERGKPTDEFKKGSLLRRSQQVGNSHRR